MYDVLIKPGIKNFKNISELLIVPDGVLALLPFETLTDEKGKFLTEKYIISYIQSISVLNLIRKRTYKKNRKPLLAFGGAIYDAVGYQIEIIQNEKQIAYLRQNLQDKSVNQNTISNAYRAIGVGQWENLPGTLKEVRKIGKIIKGASIITGKNVTEDRVKKMSANGKLALYKVIHFATHGIVVPAIPELSAVVLSQFSEQIGTEDGYLRMEEISRLIIQADFVNLSACETGLGKIYRGEGVVGLSQAFLTAGANSLSVSLWSIADESTAKFMEVLYSMVYSKGTSYKFAISQVKKMFINGDFGEKNKAPFYWAPFVYYGK